MKGKLKLHYGRKNRGQALLLMILLMGVVFIGMLGFAIDMSRMYAQRQMAQAAADAAAQAAISSIKGGTNTGANAFGNATFTCATGSTLTPCAYASLNGFSAYNGDTIKVDFPTSVGGVTISGSYSPAAARITLIRPAPTSLMKVLGITSLKIAAQSTAVITGNSGSPLVIMGGNLPDALSVTGTSTLKVCGGGQMAIAIDSCAGTGGACGSTASFQVTGSSTIDLSHAGPLDNGSCTTGTGGSLSSMGTSSITGSSSVQNGSAGAMTTSVSTAPGVNPYASVTAPSTSGLTTSPVVCSVNVGAGAPRACQQGVSWSALGCPSGGNPCNLYFPGVYPNGISLGDSANGVMAPGIYYMQATGLLVGDGSNMYSASGLSSAAVTGQGQVIFLTGTSVLNVSGSSSLSLTGTPSSSVYQGLVIWEDPTATGIHNHNLSCSGTLDVKGTILLTKNNANTSNYNSLTISGSSGATTATGQIVADKLTISGSSTITMRLPYGNSTGGNTAGGVVSLVN